MKFVRNIWRFNQNFWKKVAAAMNGSHQRSNVLKERTKNAIKANHREG